MKGNDKQIKKVLKQLSKRFRNLRIDRQIVQEIIEKYSSEDLEALVERCAAELEDTHYVK